MAKNKPHILVINGPNLNLLGKREPDKYGTQTLEDLQNILTAQFLHLCQITFFQSNHEGEIIEKLQNTPANSFVLNLGAYTHTSIAIADALTFALQNNPQSVAAEVHISNIYKRESFRHKSYISAIVDAIFVGAGLDGYCYALSFCIKKLG